MSKDMEDLDISDPFERALHELDEISRVHEDDFPVPLEEQLNRAKWLALSAIEYIKEGLQEITDRSK